jgi:predicted MFS family arabinose efflux permease
MAVLARSSGSRLALLAVTQFLVATDFDIVFVALPSIGRALGFSGTSLQWVVSAYTVALGGLLLLGGRLADRVGARRVFTAGLALFGLASLLGGFALVPGWLVGARAVQGLGAALLTPATLRLMSGFDDRDRAFAVWGAAGSLGAALGAAGGGLLTSAFGWEAVLWVNVPVVAVAVTASFVVLEPDGPAARGSFDVPGAVLGTAGALLLVYGIVAGSLLVGAGGVLVLAVFGLVERRSADPLLPPLPVGRPAAVAFLFMGAVGTAYYLITTFLQDTLGFSVLEAGAAFLPLSALSMIGSGLVFPRLVRLLGVSSTVVVGMAGLGVGLGVLAMGLAGGSYWTLLPGLGWALFAGIAFPAVFRSAGASVEPARQGVAGAVVSTAQYVGGAVGLATLLAVLGGGTAAGLGAAALALVAAVVAVVRRGASASIR